MNWQRELDELRRRERLAHAMGGPDKGKRQHDGGRLTVRERIAKLVDPESFHEVGAIAGRASYDAGNELEQLTPSNCVFGRARIDGRPVVVVGDDFTVRGGSADATIREKPLMAEMMAAGVRLPIIRIIEGSGGGAGPGPSRPRGAPPGGAGAAPPWASTTPVRTSRRCRWWRSASVRSPASARRALPPATTR